jgi:hypothetical protein
LDRKRGKAEGSDFADYAALLRVFRQRLPRPEHDPAGWRLQSFAKLLLELLGGKGNPRPIGLAHLNAREVGATDSSARLTTTE